MMLTCQDCFHFDVCDYHITELTTMTVNECPHKFVNKADVVEVVRCKECKFCYIDIFNQVCCRKSYYKETIIGVGKHDFYCADGEKGEYKLGVYKGDAEESEKSLLYADIDEIIDADYGAKMDGKGEGE